MSTRRHQDEPNASGADAALPRLSLGKLIYPGMNLERAAQGTAPASVIDVHLVGKGFV